MSDFGITYSENGNCKKCPYADLEIKTFANECFDGTLIKNAYIVCIHQSACERAFALGKGRYIDI